MLLTDHFFILYFFPIFIIAYLAARHHHRVKNILIILSSIVFYASFGFANLPILLIPVVLDFFIGIFMEKQKSTTIRKVILIIVVGAYLAVLAYFKYSLLLVTSLENIYPKDQSILGLKTFFTTIVVPVGISFIKFQRISYIFDIYRKQIKASKNFLQYATYELLFPHLISGPIVRFSDIKTQLSKRKINSKILFDGMKYFIIGLSLKVLVADQLFLVETALKQDLTNVNFLQSFCIILYFSLRIYTDFCGYSLIAIGLAKLMGFNFPHNFNAPYQSESLTDFWRRWNITLSNWIRDYLYIPLGGNRKGKIRTYFNLGITMLLAGLWHGANWNFLIWGGLHGIYLIIERFCANKKITLPLPKIAKKGLVFIIVSVTWLTFLFTNPQDIFTVLNGLVSFHAGLLTTLQIHLVLMTGLSLIAATIWAFILGENWIDNVKPSLKASAILIVLFSYSMYMTFWYGGVPFIYFQF